MNRIIQWNRNHKCNQSTTVHNLHHHLHNHNNRLQHLSFQRRRLFIFKKKEEWNSMESSYHPKGVEEGRYEWWKSNGYFKGGFNRRIEMNKEEEKEDKKEEKRDQWKGKKDRFSMVLPPPNVTGYLHIGHSLTTTIQDSLIRWNRMKGKDVVWIPGLDHAGIATQAVVEKRLWKEKKMTRKDLGREEFVKEIWKWKEKHGGQINIQQERMAASLDWSREVFTLDEIRSEAVKEAFIRLYKDGLIYRALRLVNWSCALQTVLSDIEVEHLEISGPTFLSIPGYQSKVEFGSIWTFQFPIVGEKGNLTEEKIEFATTRPETMLGDVAVAIHPNDSRYFHLHGKSVWHPLRNICIPIIMDSILVDPELGTGVVKITPSHDENDFACGKRHNLPMITIFSKEGRMNLEKESKFNGQHRFEARMNIIEEMKKMGYFVGKKNNPMSVARCSKSEDVIEPLPMPQWYVKCDQLAKNVTEQIRTKQIEIVPESSEQDWIRWLDNIQDWCISRQLWWGHRIPAYRIIKNQTGMKEGEEEQWVIASSYEDAKLEAISKFGLKSESFNLEQDEDVLDTWFSSGLFPISTLGWPKTTNDFSEYYPLNVMETGSDILFFWVSRMAMLCYHLTGISPFKRVFLHSMVRDAKGRKMSKSLGNVIDPIHLIEGVSLEQLKESLASGNITNPTELEKSRENLENEFPQGIPECGTDALRFALASYSQQGKSINLNMDRVYGYRKFCNKIWNAFIFITGHLDERIHNHSLDSAKLRLIDEWILHRLSVTVDSVENGMNNFNFFEATESIYSFFIYDLCDVYLEFSKPVLYNKITEISHYQNTTKSILLLCLENSLRLIHPFMPYISEELWQRLSPYHHSQIDSIMVAPYPLPSDFKKWKNDGSQEKIMRMLEVMTAARNLRRDHKVKKEVHPQLILVTQDDLLAQSMIAHKQEISHICKAKDIIVQMTKVEDRWPSSVINHNTKLYMPLEEDLSDNEKKAEHVKKKIQKLKQFLDDTKSKASVSDFAKTPLHVQEKTKKRILDIEKELKELESL
eukprot:TRINITY_DN741_c0_g1_i1.p1 TRINITY_DN741_c0_g1~~TRINITY_DN741_c0_g1_i1.p1  ORF type:complete len:1036 (+),score=244.27 TRINITY_DN741_c0_g1_i1:121-3228(+)